MPSVWIPAPIRAYTNGQSVVAVEGGNVRQLVENLNHAYPGIKSELMQEGMLRRGVLVAVDGEIVHKGLLQTLCENSEVCFVPAIFSG